LSPIAESGRRYAKSIPILSYCDVHLLGSSLSPLGLNARQHLALYKQALLQHLHQVV
jgi:hypothetical protein